MLIYYFKMNIDTQWIDGRMLIALLICILVSVPQTSSNDISMNVFGKDRNALPAAFGDFNSDELTDIFMLRDEGKTLEIFLASEKEPLLRPGVGLKCVFTEYRVTSVVPGDFDGDAFMDILITTQNITVRDKPSRNQDIRIIWGGEDSLNCSLLDLPTVITTVGHPLAMDYNRDMIIDLFGVSVDNIRSFWVFNHNRTRPEKIPLCEDSYHEVRLPHSNSFLDIDGDYASDLLITSPTSFEVWIGDVANPGFTLKNKIEMPIGVSGHIGQSLYLDVELTGKLYLLLPICFDKDCRSSSIMINDDSVWKTLNIEFKDKNQKEWGFFPPDGEMYRDTITMRGGDYNMDGYPDLLVTLQQDALSEPQAFLMENVPCEACPFARTYTIQWDALQPFGKGTILSVFYDFYQDGVLDFILVQQNTTTKEYRVGAMKNSLDYDANFIKVMVLTGLTNKKVPVTVGALGKKKGTYGTNLPGPKISYNTLSQDGLPRSGVCVQLPQSAYFVLNLPFSIFGLDRTPNFVDTLTVGLSNRSRTWTQLIPNSQVVVIPWPPSDPARWRAQLFVTPSKLILKSVFVITGLCGVITLLVLILHYKEKRDDRIEALSANNDDSDNEVPS